VPAPSAPSTPNTSTVGELHTLLEQVGRPCVDGGLDQTEVLLRLSSAEIVAQLSEDHSQELAALLNKLEMEAFWEQEVVYGIIFSMISLGAATIGRVAEVVSIYGDAFGQAIQRKLLLTLKRKVGAWEVRQWICSNLTLLNSDRGRLITHFQDAPLAMHLSCFLSAVVCVIPDDMREFQVAALSLDNAGQLPMLQGCIDQIGQ